MALLLIVVFPPIAGLAGQVVIQFHEPWFRNNFLGFWLFGFVALVGVMTVRYRWLQKAWGPRVTLRSWLGGCLVILLLIYPSFIIAILLACLLPETLDIRSVILFAGSVMAAAFFSRGGGLLLLRWLGVATLASPSLVEMVDRLAQEMKVPGRIKVFELHWAQVNAVALILYRAVAFSKAMVQVMNPDELRAVAAHELAHLLEPRWVRAVRVAHTFAYLPAALLINYGGNAGPVSAVLWICAVFFGYVQFSRAMERRADRVEHQAIADDQAYMRSMIKLHESNLVPAVMSRVETHPHLYDRLLSAGIHPEFPRPKAPSSTKVVIAAFVATLLSVFLLLIVLVAIGVMLDSIISK